MLGLYNAALLPVRLASAVRAAWPGSDRAEWSERRGLRVPRPPQRGIWLHGASLGEAAIVNELATALRRSRPDLALSVSATTRAGRGCTRSSPIRSDWDSITRCRCLR